MPSQRALSASSASVTLQAGTGMPSGSDAGSFVTINEEFVGYARECVRLAGLTEDENLRERLLEMARSWMAAAMGEVDRSPIPE